MKEIFRTENFMIKKLYTFANNITIEVDLNKGRNVEKELSKRKTVKLIKKEIEENNY